MVVPADHAFAFCEPKRVDVGDGIRRILILIYPALQCDGVFADEAPELRIIVPETVVVQPRFFVELLSLKSQRVAGCYAGRLRRASYHLLCVTPGSIGGLTAERYPSFPNLPGGNKLETLKRLPFFTMTGRSDSRHG